MATILPLYGKYYGTKVEMNSGDIIEVWLSLLPKYNEASIREKELGWTREDGFDHVETQETYDVAKIICDVLTEKGF
jgi:hypothetical protein